MLSLLSSAPAFLSIIPSTLALTTPYKPTAECPILGPIWPPSTHNLTSSNAFANAVAAFPSTLEALFAAGAIDPATSTFALDVYSTRTNASIYSHFHLANGSAATAGPDALSGGVLDDATVFRTGSVSKLHTVYAILVAAARGLEVFEAKVTEYVPELAGPAGGYPENFDPLTRIKWDEITIGALASQQGGVSALYAGIAACGCDASAGCNISAAPACAQDFLDYMRNKKHPAHPIYQTPTYADAGFLVLTQVLERMVGRRHSLNTGLDWQSPGSASIFANARQRQVVLIKVQTNLTYDEAIKTYLAEPLGMNVTSSIAREAQEANAVIMPPGIQEGSNWGIDNQVLAGSGGIYANLRDLRTLGLSILNNEMLDTRTTKQWMKPRGNLASPYKAVGAPWEIERLALPVSPNSTRTRISDQYTKGGGQLGYTAVFLLSPDHGLGYTVLVAGPGSGSDRWPLRAALGEAFVTAAEWAGYEYANATWPGLYVDEQEQGSNLTLTIRPHHPGAGLGRIFIAGVDWRSNLTTYGQPALPAAVLANMSTPMFPTGLAASSEDGGQRLQFRATPNFLPNVFPTTRASAEGGTGLFDDVCLQPWLTTAFYNDEEGAAIDEFVFVFDAEGRLRSVEYPPTGSRFVKAS